MDETSENLDGLNLIELLKHQSTLYRRLRLLADRQKALVALDDTQPLMGLLAERQKLVDGLVGLTDRLAPYRSKWTDFYGRLDSPQRKEVAGLLEEVNSALGSIVQSDQRDTATLAAKRQDMAERMATAEVGCRASAAYSSAGLKSRNVVTDAEA